MFKPFLLYPRLLLVIAIALAHPAYSQSEATAKYTVKFTGNWTLQSTPGGVVGGAHFTTIAGGKHNSSVSFWSSGATASSGLERLAELGITSGFIGEINASSHTDASFTSGVSGGGTGTSTFTLTVKKTHPLITLASMIGPSPDWFVGLHDYSLLDSSSNWVSSATVNLYPYDAGTENGTEFSLSNPATSPQGVITSLRNTGKFSNEPMAKVSFTRQDTPPPPPAGPTITAIERPSNASQYTNANSVTWLVTFSEAVQNVSTGDFIVNNTTASVSSTSLRSGSTTQYELTVRGGNLADLNATISLGLSSRQNITNSSNASLLTTLPSTNQTYVIDNIAPRIASVLPSRVELSPFIAYIRFSEPLQTGSFSSASDVVSEDAEVSTPTGSGASYQVSVTPNNPSKPSTISLMFPVGAGIDRAGNESIEREAQIVYAPTSQREPPTVNSVSALTNDGLYHTGDKLELFVSFDESVSVTGTPRLTLQFEGRTRDASYTRGSGSNELIFTYTLTSGDKTEDLEYANSQALTLVNASIVGSDGEPADLTLPTPGTTGSLSHASDIATSGRQDSMPSFGGAVVNDQVLMVNQFVDAITLPFADDGDLPLNYRLEPSLPTGLRLDAATHIISGTPTVELERATFSWTATDADGDAVTLRFAITVLPRMPLQFPSSASVDDRVFLQNDAISVIELPSARGGVGALTYSLSPELPMGLTLDIDAREITGTPTQPLEETTFTWLVSDEEDESVSLTFSITVSEDFQPVFDASSIDTNQVFIQDSEITSIALPSATSGNGQLTYALEPELPIGLLFDETSFTISGVPTKPQARTAFQWNVTDEDGDAAIFSFYITVLEDVMPSFTQDTAIIEHEFITDSAIEPISLPRAMGGNGSLSYRVVPDLPSGLALDSTSLEVSGTPSEAIARTRFMWVAQDVDGDTSEIEFYLTVIQDSQPVFGDQIADKEFRVGTPIDAFFLPRASGGNGQLLYDLSPQLPSGLSFDVDSGQIEGTPTVESETTTFTWQVTDVDGDSASLTFSILVHPSLPLEFTTTSPIENQVLLQNDPINTIELPSAGGGIGTLSYSLTPALPKGLTLDIEAREISGTPSEPFETTTFTWRVVDEQDDATNLTFSITVLEDFQPVFDTDSMNVDHVYIQSSEITPITLPTALSGNGELTYSLESELPDGLVFDDESFTISGIPTLPQTRTEYGWVVTDADGDSANFDFFITVLEDVMPSFALDVVIMDREVVTGSMIESIHLPAATGGNGSLSYHLAPALPDGLTLDVTALLVSGIPTEAMSRTQFSWVVQDEDGDTSELKFYLTVIQDTQPMFGDQIADMEFRVGTAIDAFVLPRANGGNGQLSYDLAPQLPNGLRLDTGTGLVEGTPTMEMAIATYTWRVNDEDGDTDSLTFTILVHPKLPLQFPTSASIEDQVFLENDAIATVKLPSAEGGDGEFKYSLSPALPMGLSLNIDAREITGTPTESLAETIFTWQVVDEEDAVARLMFSLTVLEDLQPVFETSADTNRVFIQASEITTVTLPSASSGNGKLTYTLEPELPTGLLLDEASFDISGTPTTPQTRTAYSWKATDEDGDEATFTFFITVLEDVMPSFAHDAVIMDHEFVSDSAIEPFSLPLATGGNGSLSYRLSPDLPDGLSLDMTTFVISGTPIEAASRTLFSWMVQDEDGDSTKLTFHLTVIQDTQPVFDEQVGNKVFIAGTPIDAFTLPRASGGNGQLTYEFTPLLPEGLRLEMGTGLIDGIPTSESPSATFTWRVTDGDGDSTSLTFSIVIQPAAPEVSGAIPNVTLVVGGSSQTIDMRAVITGTVTSWQVEVGDPSIATATASSTGVLTLTPHLEGQSSITVNASNITAAVEFSVSVNVVTDAVENDQINSTLSLKAGALLSSAMNVFKHRSRSHDHSGDAAGAAGFDLATKFTADELTQFAQLDPHEHWFGQEHSSGSLSIADSSYTRTRSNYAPLNFSHTTTRWSMWGAVDLQNFSSDVAANEIDGSATSLYMGADLSVSENVVAGLAVAHHGGSSSYEFSSDAASGSGEIDSTLMGLYPYLQAGDGDRFSMFLVGGIGFGDAQLDRQHAGGSDLAVDTDLTLFAGGFEYIVLSAASIDFSVVGNAGVATLTTEAGPGVLEGRDASSSKSSIGASAAYEHQSDEGVLITAADIRFATGAEGDESGSGFELGANLNYIGSHIDFMLDGRTSSRSSLGDVQRNSISARLRYKAKSDGSGLNLTLSPRWQNGSLLSSTNDILDLAYTQSIHDAHQSVEGELSYGFWRHNENVLVEPRLAWQRLTSHDAVLKVGSRWNVGRAGRMSPRVGFDLTQTTSRHRPESYGFAASIEMRL